MVSDERADGTGIFPMLFLEYFIFCVNASLLENFEYPSFLPEEEEEEDAVDSSENNPELMDVIQIPPTLDEEEDGSSLNSVSGSHRLGYVHLCGIVAVIFSFTSTL